MREIKTVQKVNIFSVITLTFIGLFTALSLAFFTIILGQGLVSMMAVIIPPPITSPNFPGFSLGTIVSPCSSLSVTDKLACNKAFFRFACSEPVAIYATDYAVSITNPFIDARITEPCSSFCNKYFSASGFASTVACRQSAINFVSGNNVLASSTDGTINLTNPYATDPSLFSFNPSKLQNYCNSLMTAMKLPLTHNWNTTCYSAINNFINASTKTPNGYIGFKRWLIDRLRPCGNGITDGSLGEECDDGNFVNGDGCSSHCISEISNVTTTNNLWVANLSDSYLNISTKFNIQYTYSKFGRKLNLSLINVSTSKEYFILPDIINNGPIIATIPTTTWGGLNKDCNNLLQPGEYKLKICATNVSAFSSVSSATATPIVESCGYSSIITYALSGISPTEIQRDPDVMLLEIGNNDFCSIIDNYDETLKKYCLDNWQKNLTSQFCVDIMQSVHSRFFFVDGYRKIVNDVADAAYWKVVSPLSTYKGICEDAKYNITMVQLVIKFTSDIAKQKIFMDSVCGLTKESKKIVVLINGKNEVIDYKKKTSADFMWCNDTCTGDCTCYQLSDEYKNSQYYRKECVPNISEPLVLGGVATSKNLNDEVACKADVFFRQFSSYSSHIIYDGRPHDGTNLAIDLRVSGNDYDAMSTGYSFIKITGPTWALDRRNPYALRIFPEITPCAKKQFQQAHGATRPASIIHLDVKRDKGKFPCIFYNNVWNSCAYGYNSDFFRSPLSSVDWAKEVADCPAW